MFYNLYSPAIQSYKINFRVFFIFENKERSKEKRGNKIYLLFSIPVKSLWKVRSGSEQTLPYKELEFLKVCKKSVVR